MWQLFAASAGDLKTRKYSLFYRVRTTSIAIATSSYSEEFQQRRAAPRHTVQLHAPTRVLYVLRAWKESGLESDECNERSPRSRQRGRSPELYSPLFFLLLFYLRLYYVSPRAKCLGARVQPVSESIKSALPTDGRSLKEVRHPATALLLR